MATGLTILALYEQHYKSIAPADRYPFAVRKTRWSPGYYVVVEAVHPLTGVAYGVPVKNGHWVPLFVKNAGWQKDHQVPDATRPYWEIVPGVDMQHYRNHSVPGQIYELHYRLKWGKHRGLSIEELCQEQLPYIYWCIECLADNFCLSAKAVKTLAQGGIVLAEDVAELNQEKLKWYKSGLQDKYKPLWFDLKPDPRVDDSYDNPFGPPLPLPSRSDSPFLKKG